MAANSFQFFNQKIQTDGTRKVDFVDVEVIAKDYTGTFNFTDIMLQSGTVATSWNGHVSEIRWSNDA